MCQQDLSRLSFDRLGHSGNAKLSKLLGGEFCNKLGTDIVELFVGQFVQCSCSYLPALDVKTRRLTAADFRDDCRTVIALGYCQVPDFCQLCKVYRKRDLSLLDNGEVFKVISVTAKSLKVELQALRMGRNSKYHSGR